MPVVRYSLPLFTRFRHRTARVARYSVPLCCTPFRATLAFSFPLLPTPTRRLSGVRQSLRFVPQNIYARRAKVQWTFEPECRVAPLHIPLAIRRFALQWVLTACGSLVLLHTLAPSSLAAPPSPQTPSRCSLRSRIDYWGAAAAKYYARLRVAAGPSGCHVFCIPHVCYAVCPPCGMAIQQPNPTQA